MNEQLLWELYKNSTIEEMASVLKVSKKEVARMIKKYNFVERFKEGVVTNCKRCHLPITITDKRTKFCPHCVAELAKDRATDAMARYKARAELKECPPTANEIREYTETSDMIIQDWVDKGMSTKEIARLLNRNHDNLLEHIEWMKEHKIFDKVRTIKDNYKKYIPSRVPNLKILNKTGEM